MREMMMFVMLCQSQMKKILNLSNQTLKKSIQVENTLYLDLTGYVVVIIMTNFDTMEQKYTPVLMLTLNIYNGVILEIATIRLLIYFVRLLQQSKRMADVIHFSALIRTKKLSYWPKLITIFFFLTKKQKENLLKS